MSEISLNVRTREKHTKGYNNNLRKEKVIPGIVYGPHKENVMVSIDKVDLEKHYFSVGDHYIFNLNIDDGKKIKKALIKRHQKHPITKEVVHVDFYEIEEGRKLKCLVPIKLEGNPKGVKEGGILEQSKFKIRIQCLPKNIPEFIEVNIEELDVGHMFLIRDLEQTDKYKILEKGDQVIVGVVSSRKAKLDEEALLGPAVAGEEGEEGEEGETTEEKTEEKAAQTSEES